MRPTDQITDPAWQDIEDRDEEIERLRGEVRKLRTQLAAFAFRYIVVGDSQEAKRARWNAETERICTGAHKV